MPTSPNKRPTAGGRLGHLLASLRPPARAGPLPVQTGFPTSLADLLVKNHVRLKNPRRRHRPSAAPQSPTAVSEPPPSPPPPPPPQQQQQQQQRPEVSLVQDGVARPKGASFSIRPELLAVGGAVALALLAIWSKRLVAAATLASVTLFWIESVWSPASRRRQPAEAEELDSCGRGLVSPIREAESAGETPRMSCAGSDTGSEVSSLWAADSRDLAGGEEDSAIPKRKEKRRSLRNLIAKKLHNGKRCKDEESSHYDGESKHPDAVEAVDGARPVKNEPLAAPAEQRLSTEAITEERCRRGGALPLAALIPVVLVGLVAGELPAVALTVLCAAFFSSVERAPGQTVI